jgi:hypothetical protein
MHCVFGERDVLDAIKKVDAGGALELEVARIK